MHSEPSGNVLSGSQRGSHFLSYGWVLLAVVAATLARWQLDSVIGDHLPFTLFYIPVIFAAWIGGLRHALLATILGFAFTWYFFLPDRFSWSGLTAPNVVGLAMYVTVSVAIAGFGESLRMERRRLERVNAERLANARLLASIVDSSDDAIVSKSLDGIVQSWNAAAERLFGYTTEQAVGRHISMLIPADRIDEEDLIIARMRAGERLEHFDTVRLRRDGRPVHVSLTISPVKDADGRIVGASKIIRDITEHKELEAVAAERLRHAKLDSEIGIVMSGNETLPGMLQGCTESLVRNLQGAFARIWTLNEQLDVLDLRASAGMYTHMDGPHGRVPVGQFKIGRIANERKPHLTNTVIGDPLVPEQEWAIREGMVAFAGYPLLVNDRLIGVVAMFARQPLSDATLTAMASAARGIALGIERKEMEDRLRQVVADLSEAGHRKDEFLAMLAHELRNPLAPIRNGLQLIKLAGGQSADVEQARSMMERQLTQLIRLVDDLMDVSRITRGKIELKKQPVLLSAVIDSAVETNRPLVDEMGHELMIMLPKQQIIVYADHTRLAQVFLNLLNNAAKYSDAGGQIKLTAERQGSDVIVSIKDSGIGIPADKLPDIFDMFTQVDRSLEKSQGGLGIGLTLVKQLVEMHDGRIEAKSDGPGMGSEFVVRLPVVAEALEPLAAPDDEPAVPKSLLRILIVDDNRDGANSLSMMLKIMGSDTRTAYDGREGVDVADEFRPDAVLFDIGLPKLNGYEAARLIREQSWGKNVVLIAVTGWGQDEDRRRSQEAGFDHHLVKPVDPKSLMNLLAGLQR